MHVKSIVVGALAGVSIAVCGGLMAQARFTLKDDSNAQVAPYMTIERTGEVPDRITIDVNAVCMARKAR